MKEIFFTPSDVIEYLFCPRFTYFMEVLKIPQQEQTREKVLIGRSLHKKKQKENTTYLRKRLSIKEKIVNAYLISPRYHIKGIVDELLFTKNNQAIIIDYKFAEYKEYLYDTYRTQLAMYGLCVRDIYQREIKRGFIVFTRSSNKMVEVSLSEEDYHHVLHIIHNMLKIIEFEYFPPVKKNQNKCIDCTYQKICV
ncbi:CRISPR-associated protein Cas4 [Thermospira aquatica]|uniref:CRISPR-associated exonuclease Cas4 n=1 Tax=Thermospira aquatica TaxID=2828656 RepID=A0AAX3BGL7_9SPIR|nr:CRISPR-associated protein Cas4 [Thermospira aquatica]URA11169.1 CRISPR-associated protein Cas4 [Thermospira aquatica]